MGLKSSFYFKRGEGSKEEDGNWGRVEVEKGTIFKSKKETCKFYEVKRVADCF